MNIENEPSKTVKMRAIILDAIKHPGDYSHNLISACLREHAQINGYEKTNALVDEFRLERFGINKVRIK